MASAAIAAFIEELTALLGAANVLTDTETCARASSSWSPLFFKAKQQAGGAVPDPVAAVVRPVDAAEVVAVVRRANETRAAMLVPLGGGSSTVGAHAAAQGRPRIAVDLSRLNAVHWDEESLLLEAGAGCVLASLEEQLNRHGYTLGQYPQSLNLATVGGVVATDAVGAFSGAYGRQADLTRALEAVLPSGQVVRTSAQAAGPGLHRLLIGSEGTLGIVTGATLRMFPMPEARAWAVFTFASFPDAVDALRLVYRSDARPAVARVWDADAATEPLAAAGLPPGSGCLLLMGFEGSEVVQTGHYQMAHAVCQKVGGRELGPEIGDAWYDARYQTGWMAANGRPGGLADAFSVWCPWPALKEAHTAMRRAAAPLATGAEAQVTHPGPDGAALDLFVTAQAEPNEPEAARDLYLRLTDAVLGAAVDAGATSVAHHYGVGETRRAWWERERGPEALAALRALKAALDPNGVLPPL
jgi:FAD/FMN-containing dehydrogenases